jgi:hypothetical protein
VKKVKNDNMLSLSTPTKKKINSPATRERFNVRITSTAADIPFEYCSKKEKTIQVQRE